MDNKSVSYTGSVQVGQAEPRSLPAALIASQVITDFTGAVAQ
jgi:hypothetical protein